MTSQKSTYSSIFNLFFLYQNLTSFAWIKMEKPWRSSIFWVPHPRKVPTSMVVGEIPELPELPISHNLTALDGSKTSAFLEVFFFGGGGFTGKLQTGNLIFWSGFFFLLSKCCSLDFFLTHWFESMAITVMIIHFLTVPLKMSDLKGILGSYVLSHLFIASFFRRHSRSLM